jgi:hypothetical protein
MDDNPFFCDDCDMELTHDDIRTASPIPQLDIESYEMIDNVAEVYQCSHCGLVIGFEPQ